MLYFSNVIAFVSLNIICILEMVQMFMIFHCSISSGSPLFIKVWIYVTFTEMLTFIPNIGIKLRIEIHFCVFHWCMKCQEIYT